MRQGVVRPGFSWMLGAQQLNLTGEIPTTDIEIIPSYITAQQCCKVGESLIRKVNTCQEASLRSNMLIKGHQLRQEIAKSLALEISRCQKHQHLLNKCCLFRLQYVIALEMCDTKMMVERYKCRTHVSKKLLTEESMEILISFLGPDFY
uniref:Uncharacterized protein n=1 Tax=Strigamia maritima TaxID=126957 RepID=T1IWP9_STRMM